MKFELNAAKLRLILMGIVALEICIVIAALPQMSDLLIKAARSTDHAKIDNEVSQQELERLKNLRFELASQKDVIARAKQIAISSAQYKYQDQIISDLSAYANRRNVGITSFDFGTTSTTAQASAGRTAFLVSLRSPLKYDSLLNFIRDVELNLTKIKVTSVNLAPNPRNPTELLNPSVGMEVFITK